jgi:hypothetical protein
MTEQQQQQQQQSGTGASDTGGQYPPSQPSNSTGNKDSGGNKGSGNNNNNNIKATKKKAARDRKKARNKLQKKDRPVENFTAAIKDTGHLIYGIVITPSVGNMADQCRVFIKQSSDFVLERICIEWRAVLPPGPSCVWMIYIQPCRTHFFIQQCPRIKNVTPSTL